MDGQANLMSGFLTFLLVLHGIIALVMVVLILLQKSEGGGLTGGSQSGGMVSARGSGDLLTRATAIMATLFILSSLLLAYLANHSSKPKTIDTSLARTAATAPAATAPAASGAAEEDSAPPIAQSAEPVEAVAEADAPAPDSVPLAN